MSVDNNHIELPEFVVGYLVNQNDEVLQERVVDWLKDAENQKVFNQLTDIWQSALAVRGESNYSTKEAWAKINDSIPLHDRRKITGLAPAVKSLIINWAAVAAIIICASVLGIWLYNLLLMKNKPVQYTEYTVPYGSRSRIISP